MNIDENRAADLLSPLLDVEPAPPRVDLREAIQTARRRQRTYRMAGAGGVVAAVAVVAVAVPFAVSGVRHGAPASRPTASAAAVPHSATSQVPTSLSCTEQLLPIPDGVTKALVTGGDPTGRHIAGRSYPTAKVNHEQTLMWDNGVAHKVPIPGADAAIDAITSNGTAIANSFSGDIQSAFIYRDGKVTKLGGATDVGAMGVNNAGTVVGGRTVDNASLPVVWRTPTSPATDLPMPGSSWRGTPSAVLDDGTIIGSVSPSVTSDESRGIVWHPDGTFQLLPLPKIAGASGINGFLVFNVRGNVIIGQGVANTPKLESFYPVAYDLSTGKYTDLTKASMAVSGGNAQHWLVGSSGNVVNPSPSLWTPGTGLIHLPTLTSKTDIGDAALYVSDDGKVIAGQNTDKHGVIRAVVWRCH